MKAIALALALLLCSLGGCATPSPWMQEEELQTILPETKISFLDLPAPVASEIVKAIEYCKENYPAAVDHIKEIKTDYSISKKSTFPVEYYATTTMALLYPWNSIKLNDAVLQSLTSVRKQYQMDVWLGFHVAVPRNKEMFALIIHELGHVLTANLYLQDNMDVIKLYQIYKQDANTDTFVLGTNAQLNILEFISECFVDAVCNGDKAQGISKAFIKIVKDLHITRNYK